jgi:hypothetical protein
MMTLPWDKLPLVETIYHIYDLVVQVSKQSTLHQISMPGALNIPQKVPQPIAMTRQDIASDKICYHGYDNS